MMALTPEEKRKIKSVTDFMEMCTKGPASSRYKIACSDKFRNFVLDMAQEGLVKNKTMLSVAHKICAAACEAVQAEEKSKAAEKKREVLEAGSEPIKRLKLCPVSETTESNVPETINSCRPPWLQTPSLASTRDNTSAHLEALSPSVETKEACPSSSRDGWNSGPGTALSPVRKSPFETKNEADNPDVAASSDRVFSGVERSPATVEKGIEPQDTRSATVDLSTGGILARTTAVMKDTPQVHRQRSPSDGDESDVPSEKEDSLFMPAPSSELQVRVFKEKGIISSSPAVIDPIKSHCLRCSKHKEKEYHIDTVLEICARFNFDLAKHRLLTYIGLRPSINDNNGPSTDIPYTSDMDSALELAKALRIMARNDQHSQIYRAFTQLKFFFLVNNEPLPSGLTKHLKHHLRVIEGMANGNADDEKHYTADYHRGKRWNELVKRFDGAGIILIFATMDIVSTIIIDWNNFQRDCLGYIASHLASIKKLVRSMGDGVLEQYCRYGNVSMELTREIRAVEGYC